MLISVAGFEHTTPGGWIRLRPILGLCRDRVSMLRVTQQLAPKPIRLRLRLRRDGTDTSVRVPLAPQVAWGAVESHHPGSSPNIVEFEFLY